MTESLFDAIFRVIEIQKVRAKHKFVNSATKRAHLYCKRASFK